MMAQVGLEKPVRSRRTRCLRQRRASTSLEFAAAAVPLFLLVLGTIELGYDMFVQEVLDNAVEAAARGVQVGSVQGTANEKSSAFVAQAVCPNLGGMLNCNNLVVGVQPVPSGLNFYTAPTMTMTNAQSVNGAICTGLGGQMMQLQAWYIGPSFVGMMIPSFTTNYNGKYVHIATAGAGFVNQGFVGGQSGGTQCT
jgi:Flp pilus assembly protein TadG